MYFYTGGGGGGGGEVARGGMTSDYITDKRVRGVAHIFFYSGQL